MSGKPLPLRGRIGLWRLPFACLRYEESFKELVVLEVLSLYEMQCVAIPELLQKSWQQPKCGMGQVLGIIESAGTLNWHCVPRYGREYLFMKKQGFRSGILKYLSLYKFFL